MMAPYRYKLDTSTMQTQRYGIRRVAPSLAKSLRQFAVCLIAAYGARSFVAPRLC